MFQKLDDISHETLPQVELVIVHWIIYGLVNWKLSKCE
jgi:hypothetical protein